MTRLLIGSTDFRVIGPRSGFRPLSRIPARERYGRDEPPQLDAGSEIPALIQGTVNAASPAWRRLDTLIRTQLGV
ncbi:hypothetical protein [Streptomyces sp. NPDC059863]|uniref:hypothetical protein n=1 Tax=unclassified Streptomyces TaxID=2593676 RepID=UPI003660F00E